MLQQQVMSLEAALKEAKGEARDAKDEGERGLVGLERELSENKIKLMVAEHSVAEQADTLKKLQEQLTG